MGKNLTLWGQIDQQSGNELMLKSRLTCLETENILTLSFYNTELRS